MIDCMDLILQILSIHYMQGTVRWYRVMKMSFRLPKRKNHKSNTKEDKNTVRRV